MEFITSYISDPSETELSDVDEIEKPKTDFFNLEESDDEVNDNKTMGNKNDDLLCQASCLSDQPYGPASLDKNILKNKLSSASSHSVQSTSTKRQNDPTTNPSSKKIHLCTPNVYQNEVTTIQTSVIESNIGSTAAYRTSKCEKNVISGVEKSCISQNKKHIEDIFNNPSDICYDNSNYKNFIPKHQWRSYQAHTLAVTALSWNLAKYGHLLLTSSIDSTLKIWSSLLSYNCVKEFAVDYGIKAAKWSLSGMEVICGGYDKKATVFDISTGKCLSEFPVKDFVSSIEIHPESQDIFLIGTKDNIFAFDKRHKEPIKCYYSKCQYVLDLAFMKTSGQFIASTEVVSHDCADRTLIVWDFATSAILSNQIFSECYTCPCVKVSPDEKQFVAQTNGNYIAIFSTKRPYKLKQKRFMGHEVAGYAINCDFSPDSQLLVSGDAKGGMYFYNSFNCNLIKKIEAKTDVPAVQVNWHPTLSSTVATGFWDGTIQIWQ